MSIFLATGFSHAAELEPLGLFGVPSKRAPKRSASTPETSEQNSNVAKRSRTVTKTKNKDENHVDLKDPKVRLILREIKTGGIVLATGQGDVGQLGLGEDILEKTKFTAIPSYNDIIAIAAGGMHNVCLTKEGKVLTFGCNDEGALGRNTSKEGSETVPDYVELPARAIQVTAGDSHSSALLEDGRVFIWGSFRDSHGTMGLLTKENERFPVEIKHATNKSFIKIASGSDHLVLLDNNKQIFTCGCGEQGQLGRLPERKTDRNSRQGVSQLLTPGQVYFKMNKHIEVEDIWAGSYCTFVKVSHNNEIYAFGLNNYGQMGLKGIEKQFHPKLSESFSKNNWTHISTGQHHSIALDDQGKVYTIGRKEYGRLGLGAVESDALEPVINPTLEAMKVIDVAAGSAQSFAVTDSGKLYAWGMGTSGNLGTGEEEDADIPTLIDSKQLKDVKLLRVAGGGQHTIVLGLPAAASKTNNSTAASKSNNSTTESKSNNSTTDSKPSNLTAEPKLSNLTTEPKSSNSTAEPKSKNLVDDSKSNNSTEDSKSNNTSDDPKSSDSTDDPKPSNSTDDPKPNNLTDDTKSNNSTAD